MYTTNCLFALAFTLDTSTYKLVALWIWAFWWVKTLQQSQRPSDTKAPSACFSFLLLGFLFSDACCKSQYRIYV